LPETHALVFYLNKHLQSSLIFGVRSEPARLEPFTLKSDLAENATKSLQVKHSSLFVRKVIDEEDFTPGLVDAESTQVAAVENLLAITAIKNETFAGT